MMELNNVRSKLTVLYSVSQEGRDVGRFWTLTKPEGGPTKEILDRAISAKFNNNATQIIKTELPAGEAMFEGFVSGMDGMTGTGARQIFIEKESVGKLLNMTREAFQQ